jgi:CRP-like cAMP-binding protein
MSVRTNAEFFRRIPLFAECADTHLQLLAFTSQKLSYRPGERIVRAGERGFAGYLVMSGTADVWVEEGETKKSVATVGPGGFIGEYAMIAGLAYAANVSAIRDVTAMRVSRDVFLRVVREFPEFGVDVYRVLAQRIDLSLSDLNRLRVLFEQAQSPAERKIESR